MACGETVAGVLGIEEGVEVKRAASGPTAATLVASDGAEGEGGIELRVTSRAGGRLMVGRERVMGDPHVSQATGLRRRLSGDAGGRRAGGTTPSSETMFSSVVWMSA
jgi:hypothetical protein